uniref:Synaptobrevin, longin-like domain protein n=1 Tax=Tanacetum cinerariifolium TaxID=118510 RepID=A0A6L2NG29_TANCI|nr:hypothetical protein [Tanacetum cinerariifolium]
MVRLAFCDYHNIIAILEKYEHNVDFHQIVDFVEASHIRYALTINPTVYVSHIRQFWSTARIETTDEGTKILATVDGKRRTIFESSIRRNLKLNDEAGISSLPDVELFENLALMGYNILPNHPKSTGFNEFSSNIATAMICLATNRVYNFSKMIFDGMVRNVNNKVSKFLMYPRDNSPSFSGQTVPLFDSMLVHQGEGSGTLTEPHLTPSPEAQQSSPTAPSSPSLPPATTETIPTVIPTDIPLPLGNTPGELGLLRHDRANIIKSSTLPYDSAPRVTSLAADEGNLEIASLKAKIKMLKGKDGGGAEPSGEDATIKRRSLETGEEASVDKSTKKGSNDTEELVNVLTSLDATSILTSGVQVVSVPPAIEVTTVSVPTGSGMVPTAGSIFTTASVVTPYARRKEEQMTREDQRRSEQIARDAEIARIHVEEELQMLIDGLDRTNETIAKYLQKYEQFAVDLSIGEKIDMINELVKYQDHYAKGMSLKEIREKFIPVWKKIKDFVRMASKEEGEICKRKWLGLEQESPKKMKTSHEVSVEDLKEMIQLGGHTAVYQFFVDMLKYFNREDLTQLWTLVRETLSIRQATSDKEKEL